MTKYIAVYYAGAGYGFHGRPIEASSKQSAKAKYLERYPDKARMVGIYTMNEFLKSFYNKNGSKISYLAAPKSGLPLRDWNELMDSHGLGLSWTKFPYWAKSIVQRAAIERIREGKHVW